MLWLLVAAPALLGVFVRGSSAASYRELTVACALCVSLRRALEHFALAGSLGFRKSYAIEDPLEFWTLWFLVELIVWVALALVSRLAYLRLKAFRGTQA